MTDLAVLPGRFVISVGVGVVFLVVGVAQVSAGVAILRTRSSRRRLMLAAAALGLVVLGWWGLSQATGWMVYQWWLAEDGAVGFTDWICAALQGLSVLLLGLAIGLGTVRRPRPDSARPPQPSAGRRARRLAATAALLVPVVVLTIAGLGMATDGFRRVGETPGRTLRVGDAPLPAGSTTTLTFCRPDGIRLNMDVYEPPAAASRPTPAAVYLHGGGFILGNRHTGGLANHAGALFDPLRAQLTGSGFVVVSVDYRLAPLTRWPDQIRDAACAIRFIRTFATQLGVDPGRIGVWGSSAGATLAALLGTAGGDIGFDVGSDLGSDVGSPYRDQSSGVQAVVSMFGAADMDHFDDAGPLARFSVNLTFGSSHERRRAGSPLTYISATDPPFLILHGTDDPDVPPRQSIELAQRLTAAGINTSLVLVKGAQHGLNTPGQDPTPAQLTHTVTEFFGQTLRRS